MTEQYEFVLDFEKPIIELEQKIKELKGVTEREGMNLDKEIRNLELRLRKLQKETFLNLSPWRRVQLARHPDRPKTLTLANLIFDEFLLLRGDRFYADDEAMVVGLARLGKEPVIFLGNQKGKSIKENLYRNFGMAHPEGYRKAKRLMSLAEKFSRPIITFVDTPGAYPGIEAEERGQAEAIAANLEKMSWLKVPIIVVIIGEGGSGGALGIGIGNSVLMLENAIFSVITPEGCAAILWKNQEKVEEAAKALKLTARNLLELKLIDGIIPEPRGGAHRDVEQTARNIKRVLLKELSRLKKLSPQSLARQRFKKYREMGSFKRG